MKNTSQKLGMEKFGGKDIMTPDFPLYAMAYARFGLWRNKAAKSGTKK